MNESTPSVIGFDDFTKVDIRVGLVTEASKVPKSDKLVKLTVDFGPELGFRTIVAGIGASYDVFDLPGNNVLAVVNLESRKLMGIESHGMLLAGALDDGQPRLARCSGCAPGTRVH